MLSVVGMREMDAIFQVTDRLGISREEIEVPLGPERPGKIRRLPNGKWEIVVDSEVPIDEFLSLVEAEIVRQI